MVCDPFVLRLIRPTTSSFFIFNTYISKKTELDIIDKAKSGIIIGALNKDLKGKADGADIKIVVEQLFI